MVRAPNIVGDVWFNTGSLTAVDLRGKIVLYDFWTYSCVNCQRTLPYLKAWWESYKNKNFLLIGIHTPEFEFEKDLKNVEKAIIEASFNGQSKEVRVTNPAIYDLLRSKELMDGVLTLTAKEGSFRAYAFTFSGCEH